VFEETLMSFDQVLEISRQLFYTSLLVALPALSASLVVGLLVSIMQTVTSIQDQTVSYVPRLIAVGVVVLLALPFSLQLATHFTVRMFEFASGVVH
jgi:flagellar biosynthetic protein FliQ